MEFRHFWSFWNSGCPRGHYMHKNTHKACLAGGKDSAKRKWVLVKLQKGPVSDDPQETCFKSMPHSCSGTYTFRVHSQPFSPVSWRESMNSHPCNCMAACRGPYYEGKGPSTFSMLGWNSYHIMVMNGTVVDLEVKRETWHSCPKLMEAGMFEKIPQYQH